MSTSSSTTTHSLLARHGHDLVESWVRLAKAFALYPPTHERVAAMLRSFRAKIAGAAEAFDTATVTVAFGVGRTWLNGHDAADHPSPWLRERLDAGHVAAVVFAIDVPAESLAAFSLRLLEIAVAKVPRDVPFDELWPTAWRGIELVERRFEGVFDETATATGAPVGGPGSGILETREVLEIARRLTEDEGIGELLGALERMTENGDDGFVRVDVVGRILKLLPADLRRSEDASYDAVRSALATLVAEAHRIRAAAGAGVPDRRSITDLLLAVRSGLFGRELAPDAAPTPNPPDATASAGDHGASPSTPRETPVAELPAVAARGSDEAIDDDPELFEAERTSLPRGLRLDLAADESAREAEQIATALALFLSDDDADSGERLGANLIRLLEGGSERSIGMLGALLGDLDRPAAGMDRLVDLLRRCGQARILKCCRFLDARAALERFPRHFGLFLETWDPQSTADHSELGSVCRDLGRARILSAAPTLLGQEHLAAHAASLCTRGPLDAAPLIEVLVLRGDEALRRAALAFVRRIPLAEALARPLWIVDETAALPVPVLRGLLSIAAGEAEPPALRDALGAVLVDFVGATTGRAASRARRLYAIANLPAYPSPQTRALLRTLASHWKRFLPFAREAAETRRAAKAALAALPPE